MSKKIGKYANGHSAAKWEQNLAREALHEVCLFLFWLFRFSVPSVYLVISFIFFEKYEFIHTRAVLYTYLAPFFRYYLIQGSTEKSSSFFYLLHFYFSAYSFIVHILILYLCLHFIYYILNCSLLIFHTVRLSIFCPLMAINANRKNKKKLPPHPQNMGLWAIILRY